MNNQLANTSNLSQAEFLQAMANLEGGNQRNRPQTIRLNGQTGKWETRKWNQGLKAMESVVIGDSWNGIILFVKYFAKWKFGTTKPNQSIRTREFMFFKNEQIELLDIDYSKNENNTESLGFFQDYTSFKREHANIDKVTDKETFPFDLWCSLYILRLEDMTVVNVNMKGQSRSNLFDYKTGYKNAQPNAKALAQVVTVFGSEAYKMPGDASKEYCGASFKADAIVGDDVMLSVQKATQELVQWMQSFKEDAEEERTVKVHVDEIDPSQIPF